MTGLVPPSAVAAHSTGVPTVADEALSVTPVIVSAVGVVIITGALSEASLAVDEPAFRAKTWIVYDPGSGGSHVHAFEASQSRAIFVVDPSNTKNS